MKRLIAMTLLLVALAPLASAKEAVPFINDNYETALARAKAKNLPIFVEAWAPW